MDKITEAQRQANMQDEIREHLENGRMVAAGNRLLDEAWRRWHYASANLEREKGRPKGERDALKIERAQADLDRCSAAIEKINDEYRPYFTEEGLRQLRADRERRRALEGQKGQQSLFGGQHGT